MGITEDSTGSRRRAVPVMTRLHYSARCKGRRHRRRWINPAINFLQYSIERRRNA
ncbi:MAG: hypothetical protein U0703_29070 [Anaerolineae bacterium]